MQVHHWPYRLDGSIDGSVRVLDQSRHAAFSPRFAKLSGPVVAAAGPDGSQYVAWQYRAFGAPPFGDPAAGPAEAELAFVLKDDLLEGDLDEEIDLTGVTRERTLAALAAIVIPAIDWVRLVPERIGRVKAALDPLVDPAFFGALPCNSMGYSSSPSRRS